jgi:anti-sigma B factor antagonist
MTTNYRLDRAQSHCKVTVNGALTAIVIPEIKEALKKEIQQLTREIVFDLQDTTMLDSSGIGLLIATSNTLAQKEGVLRVVNPSQEVFQLLRHMHLVSRLNVGPVSQQRTG